jgi:hypothetical protein
MLRSLKLPTDLDTVFFIDGVIQSKVYNKHYLVEKHFSISIKPVRSRDGSLVFNAINVFCLYFGSCAIKNFIIIIIKTEQKYIKNRRGVSGTKQKNSTSLFLPWMF